MRNCSFCFALVLLVSWVSSSVVNAQLNGGNLQAANKPPLKMSARYHIESGSTSGFLIVKIEIPKGSYIYGLTQTKPLLPSKLTLKQNSRIQVKAFSPDQKPKVIENDPIFKTRLEKHMGTVQFFAPIQVTGANDLDKLKPTVLFSGQVCSEQGYCQTIKNQTISAKFEGFFQREARKTAPTSRGK